MTETIKVLIADDHPIVRQGMEMILASESDMELIAQASNGQEAVDKALITRPDVIVMDLQMPVKDGLTAIQEIANSGIGSQILVLTSFPDDDMVVTAIKAGASGILLKDSPPNQLLDAIRVVYRGESALHPIIARKLMTEIRQVKTPQPEVDPLTPRELDVLECLARGLSNQEIALELTVSVRTVYTHVRNILDKLHLANRTQAALYAVDHGIVQDPDE